MFAPDAMACESYCRPLPYPLTRPMFGAGGAAPGKNSIAFVSQAALDFAADSSVPRSSRDSSSCSSSGSHSHPHGNSRSNGGGSGFNSISSSSSTVGSLGLTKQLRAVKNTRNIAKAWHSSDDTNAALDSHRAEHSRKGGGTPSTQTPTTSGYRLSDHRYIACF